MPKSKQQKQQEALERLRGHYGEKAARWRTTQYGTAGYAEYERRWGEEKAKEWAANEDRVFKKYLKEAQLDSSGNPL